MTIGIYLADKVQLRHPSAWFNLNAALTTTVGQIDSACTGGVTLVAWGRRRIGQVSPPTSSGNH